MLKKILLLFLLAVVSAAAGAREAIILPNPNTTGGKPLMQALKERKSTREFSAETLSAEVLSNLLWAAFGVNRPDGKRTAPSAMDRQEIDIYVVVRDGVYVYDARLHRLQTVASGDLRAVTGTQAFVREAPLNLVYVADYSKMATASEPDKLFYSAADTGFIAQNVYLYCASAGLATVVRASVNREAFATAVKLSPNQKITLAQSVGYPKR